MSAPFLYKAWVALSAVIVPFAARRSVNKLRAAGISVARAHEKLGHATLPRPDGKLIWFHAASVGESLSVLALIEQMGKALPNAHFLITSGTATSSRIIAQRLPARCLHQFAPLDAAGPLKRFLSHWHPDAAIFVESELWPQMLRRTFERGTSMALVNARISARSAKRWRRLPILTGYLLEVFQLILTQNDAMAETMVALNAPADRVARGINLKSMAAALPVDEDALFEAQAALGHRPVWVASSTHAGEEQQVLAAHKALLKDHPDLHLILVPRHPERGDDVAALINKTGLSMARRSAGQKPREQVYLADTLGELGLWYALSQIVFLGGSLRPIGGHNPYEVAGAGAAVISGPHVTNFAETFEEMTTLGAARMVKDADELATQVGHWLTSPSDLESATEAAQSFMDAQTNKLDGIAARLIRALDLAP